MSKTTNIAIDDLNNSQKPASTKIYRITLTRDALLLIANCVEDISRFSSGQPELSNTLMQMLAVGDNSIGIRNEVESHLRAAKKVLLPELQPGSYYPYTGGNQSDENRRNLIGNTYQIYREILFQIATNEKWNNVYSSKGLPSGNLPMIQVEIINPKEKIETT